MRITRTESRLGGAVALLLALAGCGSGGSSSITIGNENSADNALLQVTEKASISTAPNSPPAVTTPTSGPLSTEPQVEVPKGPAPKKLETKDLIVGTGAEAKAGEKITVNYVGYLYKSRKEFNASWENKEPFSFTLGQGAVIKGWDQGIAGMKVGGRRELIIPSTLAYGAKGSSPAIPANAALVFVIDLLGT